MDEVVGSISTIMAIHLPSSSPAPRFQLDVPAKHFDDTLSRALLEAARSGDLAKATDHLLPAAKVGFGVGS